MNIVSFFAGAGGLDLGFSKAGFDIIYANEFDKKIWETYEKNHPGVILDKRSIVNILSSEIPDCDGIIGGPPCQSWSDAGTKKGLLDSRGQLFFEFTRILKDKQPKFFLAENVSGMLADRHNEALVRIKDAFRDCGYDLYFKLLNATDYSAAQDRKRVIFIGFRKDLNVNFQFPKPHNNPLTLKDIIYDLKDTAVPALDKSKRNPIAVNNHEYMTGGFSSMFMSRNRVRDWDEPSFTIQAGGRHAPLHPDTGRMIKVGPDKFKFADDDKVRRLSVRECARIQGFPDSFEFFYKDVADGYKMIGNAVCVDFAYALAENIKNYI